MVYHLRQEEQKTKPKEFSPIFNSVIDELTFSSDDNEQAADPPISLSLKKKTQLQLIISIDHFPFSPQENKNPFFLSFSLDSFQETCINLLRKTQ